MSKGGSAPKTTSQTTTQTNIPEYARPYFENLLGRTVFETNRPYEPYKGQRIAQFSPYETAAMQGIAGLQAPEEYDVSSAVAGNVALAPMRESGFQAGSVTDPGMLQRYMDPYQQMVTNIQKREAIRQSQMYAPEIAGQAVSAGAFGGSREAIMQAERERNLAQQLQDIQAQGDTAAYAQALQSYEADRAARQMEEQLGAAAYGEGIANRLQAAGLMSDFGARRFENEADRLTMLQAAGETQRALAQRGLDVGYQDYLAELGFPRESLAFYSSILQGLPIEPGSTVSSYGGPSAEQQALGSGISGVALYNALRGG